MSVLDLARSNIASQERAAADYQRKKEEGEREQRKVQYELDYEPNKEVERALSLLVTAGCITKEAKRNYMILKQNVRVPVYEFMQDLVEELNNPDIEFYANPVDVTVMAREISHALPEKERGKYFCRVDTLGCNGYLFVNITEAKKAAEPYIKAEIERLIAEVEDYEKENAYLLSLYGKVGEIKKTYWYFQNMKEGNRNKIYDLTSAYNGSFRKEFGERLWF